MKRGRRVKRWGVIVFLTVSMLVLVPVQPAKAIIWTVIKAAVVKVIKAIDLAIQKQQNKIIWLQNAQKTLENTMSKLRLNEISDWTERQRDLYKDYFAELSKVKMLITYYQRIREVTEKQTQLVNEYKRAWNLVRSDKNFTPEEVEYMGKVYEGILRETVKNIDQLALVVNSFKTQMSDAKRLEIINEAADSVERNFNDLKRFNAENGMLSMSRTSSQLDIDKIRKLYGIE